MAINGVKQAWASTQERPDVKQGEVYRNGSGKLHCWHHVPLADVCPECEREEDEQIERSNRTYLLAQIGAYGVAVVLGIMVGIAMSIL